MGRLNIDIVSSISKKVPVAAIFYCLFGNHMLTDSSLSLEIDKFFVIDAC